MSSRRNAARTFSLSPSLLLIIDQLFSSDEAAEHDAWRHSIFNAVKVVAEKTEETRKKFSDVKAKLEPP